MGDEIPMWARDRAVDLTNASDHECKWIYTDETKSPALYAFARYIAEHEEPPVVIDPDVLIVREVLHAHQRSMTPPDSGWGDMSYRRGSYDDLPAFQNALAAYKAGKSDA